MKDEQEAADTADANIPHGISRRQFAWGVLGAGAAGVAAGVVSPNLVAKQDASRPLPSTSFAGVPVFGEHQAGIDRPEVPQIHCLIVVGDCSINSAIQAGETLKAIGDFLAKALQDDSPTEFLPDGPLDATVTIGIGPRLAAYVDDSVLGSGLPLFVGDENLSENLNGGDLIVQVCASDPSVLAVIAHEVTAIVPGFTLRWRQVGSRGPGDSTVARNPLGFHDGIIVPRGEDELRESVWITEGPFAGGSVLVVRKLALDVQGFAGLAVDGQERVIGRVKSSGAPLSGGSLMDEADLLAKSHDGEYLTPVRSHVRAAHPSFTGNGLMLRRSYGYLDNQDSGLLFLCFQNKTDVFISTQRRLDEQDDLMKYASIVASGVFIALPGIRQGKNWGLAFSSQ